MRSSNARLHYSATFEIGTFWSHSHEVRKVSLAGFVTVSGSIRWIFVYFRVGEKRGACEHSSRATEDCRRLSLEKYSELNFPLTNQPEFLRAEIASHRPKFIQQVRKAPVTRLLF